MRHYLILSQIVWCGPAGSVSTDSSEPHDQWPIKRYRHIKCFHWKQKMTSTKSWYGHFPRTAELWYKLELTSLYNVAQYNVEELKVVLVCELFIYCSWRISGALQTGVLVQVLVIWVRILTFTSTIWLLVEGHPHSRAHDRSISINQFSGLLKPSRASADWTESPDN